MEQPIFLMVSNQLQRLKDKNDEGEFQSSVVSEVAQKSIEKLIEKKNENDAKKVILIGINNTKKEDTIDYIKSAILAEIKKEEKEFDEKKYIYYKYKLHKIEDIKIDENNMSSMVNMLPRHKQHKNRVASMWYDVSEKCAQEIIVKIESSEQAEILAEYKSTYGNNLPKGDGEFMKSEKVLDHQTILFGPPGTGKTFKIKVKCEHDTKDKNIIRTVFHPEYTYGDFMGRLMPVTKNEKVTYKYYPGHFLKALARAYKTKEAVFLIIDELNRGNAAAIFGPIFNLLDRDAEGKSCYKINLSDLEFENFLSEIVGKEISILSDRKHYVTGNSDIPEKFDHDYFQSFTVLNDKEEKVVSTAVGMPKNLYIIATINTSDESIYYMDAAFKRRWEWVFVDQDGTEMGNEEFSNKKIKWNDFRKKLNKFILEHSRKIRNIEDKLIGPWFISLKDKEPEILREHLNDENDKDDLSLELGIIANKVMFHLWDSVFARDKSPLEELIFDANSTEKLLTYGNFVKNHEKFFEKINPEAKGTEAK